MTNVTFRKIVTFPAMHKPDGTISKGYEINVSYKTSAEGTVSDGIVRIRFRSTIRNRLPGNGVLSYGTVITN